MSIKEDLCSVGHEESDEFIGLLDSQQAIDTGKEQLAQLLNVSESLESMIKHIDNVPTMTAEHAESIRISCENLLRGTGYEYSVLVPALESYTEGTVSTESLKDKLQSLWKRIVSIILSILEGAKRYWGKVATYEGRLRMNAQSLQKLASMKKGVTIKREMTELGIEAKVLVIGAKSVTDPDTLIRLISAATAQYKVVTDNYPKAMVAAGKVYEDLYKSAGSNVRQTLEDFVGATINLPFNTLATSLRALTYRDPRFGPKQILAAPPVLGGWTLFISAPPEPTTGLVGNELTSHAARIRASGVRFAMTEVNANSSSTATARTASGTQVEQLATRVLGILDVIKSQESSRQVNKIAAQIKAVLSAAEGYKGQSHVGGDGTLVYSESILRFARSYSGWATGPVDQMTTNLLTVARAILIYGRKSLHT
jgi:hypothetical protein